MPILDCNVLALDVDFTFSSYGFIETITDNIPFTYSSMQYNIILHTTISKRNIVSYGFNKAVRTKCKIYIKCQHVAVEYRHAIAE